MLQGRAQRRVVATFLYFVAEALGVVAQATYPSEFKVGWCYGPKCVDYTISAAHFQLRLLRYYAENSRPPVREAFLLVTMPVIYQRQLLMDCPGLIVLAHLLVAEVRLWTHPPEEAQELLARAQRMLAIPELAGPHMENIQHAWALGDAVQRYEQTAAKLQDARKSPMSVDFVIPHCGEDLSWLADTSKIEVLPPEVRIFVYEKCGWSEDKLRSLSEQIGTIGDVRVIPLDDAADPSTGLAARRDECSAYLAHVINNYGKEADMTIFLHGDPSDHTPFGLLNVLLRGLSMGTLRDLGFLHLGSPRLVHTHNPCQHSIFEMAMGRPQQSPLSTYCCSQFAVSRSRIQSRQFSEYARVMALVDGTIPDACDRIGPSYEKYQGQRLSHCFFLEFMWHVVFGENEALPLRADDVRLPVALRLRDNEEEMPSLWRSYMSPHISGQATFVAQGHDRWWRELMRNNDYIPRQQLNYGEKEPD